MKAEMQGKITFGGWGLVCGAVVAIIIGFSWGGWSTAGATQKTIEKAVLDSQTAICVAQFMTEPNSKERLDGFGAIESYKRSEFIEKGGWDRMPGQKEASSGVARACADAVEPLVKK